ncbi:MAG: hypothetical protein WAX69_13850 [Victivallales bacterium]
MKPRETAQTDTPQVGVSTGNAAIDNAFRISVELLNDLRPKYHATGGLRGWLPVSGGKRGPLIHASDPRDSAHAVKMAAYLWGHEPDQGDCMENAMYLAFIHPQTGAITYQGWCGEDGLQTGTPAVSQAMYLRCAADTYRYFCAGSQFKEALRRAAMTAEWMSGAYDAEGAGLLDCHNEAGRCFWGAHLGEPNHFPPNYDPKSKTIVATMAYCVWLQNMERAAHAAGAPETDVFARHLRRVRTALEESAWSERGGYYFTQFDRVADKWFFSLNGLCEDSRETDVVPYYAAEADIPLERRHAVARWIDHALMHDRIFPMPIFYPPYAYYSPDQPNYIDHGREKSVLGGAWDTPYFHCMELLRESGLVDTLELAVRKRAEAITRDGDCIEWYHLDGTVDDATGFHRDRYVVCATAQIAATIEGLFGITPAAPNFAEINIAPSLPMFRRHRHSQPPAPHAERDNILRITLPEGRRLELTIRYSESDEVLRVRTNALGATAHFRLPVDLASRVQRVCWDGREVAYRLKRLMDHDFVCIEHALDGGALTVHLQPHPQKGKGTTPLVEVDSAGHVTFKGCGSQEPSL